MLEEFAIEELVDPRLGNEYSEDEIHWMLHAAALCIRRDPHCRPRMSQVSLLRVLFDFAKRINLLPLILDMDLCAKVLRILEGNSKDSCYTSTPGYADGNKSGRIGLSNNLSVLL